MKKRVLLKIAYDGTAYCGFQVQPNGITVQEVVNRALSDLTGEDIHTIGASRTDAGVHARGNAAVFDTEMRMDASKFAGALNVRLPEDIRIVGSEEVPADFHPRHTDTVKTYEYHILNSHYPDPTRRLYSLFCYYHLDSGAMRQALSALTGTHDFRSFQSSNETRPDKNTVRTIYSAELFCEDENNSEAGRRGMGTESAVSPTPGDDESHSDPCMVTHPGILAYDNEGFHGMMTIRLTGNGFLYNMVRIIAGTVIDIGRSKIPADSMPDIIEARDRAAAGQTAPAHGLTLVDICFPALP